MRAYTFSEKFKAQYSEHSCLLLLGLIFVSVLLLSLCVCRCVWPFQLENLRINCKHRESHSQIPWHAPPENDIKRRIFWTTFFQKANWSSDEPSLLESLSFGKLVILLSQCVILPKSDPRSHISLPPLLAACSRHSTPTAWCCWASDCPFHALTSIPWHFLRPSGCFPQCHDLWGSRHLSTQ